MEPSKAIPTVHITQPAWPLKQYPLSLCYSLHNVNVKIDWILHVFHWIPNVGCLLNLWCWCSLNLWFWCLLNPDVDAYLILNVGVYWIPNVGVYWIWCWHFLKTNVGVDLITNVAVYWIPSIYWIPWCHLLKKCCFKKNSIPNVFIESLMLAFTNSLILAIIESLTWVKFV